MSVVYGFVGTGRMGKPMTLRLLNAGKKVVVCDRDASAVASLVEAGAEALKTPADVARVAHTVFLSLPTPAIVADVVMGESGLARGGALRLVIDLSTIGPRAAQAVGAHLQQHGIDFLDSPVSGGISGARDGTLAVMVAGPKAAFESAKPVLDLFGKVFHVGEAHGQAQILKLANNLLSMAAVTLTSEVMVMGAKAGLDPDLMLDIINAGSGRNTATTAKFPRAVLPGTFDFGFTTGLAYKDVGLCVDEAEAMGVPMVVGAAVRQMMAITNASYGPESDFTSVCKVVEGWAQVKVRRKG